MPYQWSEHFTDEELNAKVIQILQNTELSIAERHRRAEVFLRTLKERLSQ